MPNVKYMLYTECGAAVGSVRQCGTVYGKCEAVLASFGPCRVVYSEYGAVLGKFGRLSSKLGFLLRFYSVFWKLTMKSES